jgi:hypothetical protein
LDAAGPWLTFVLAALATWRVTHLLANEDGPADVVFKLRRRIGDGFIGALMDCFNCMSVWVAAAFAFFLSRSLGLWFLSWLALSGAACLLERLAGEAGKEPARAPPIEEETDDVLR